MRSLLLSLTAVAALQAEPAPLDNGLLRAEFDARGLTALTDHASGRTWRFDGDRFSLTVSATTPNGGATETRLLDSEFVPLVTEGGSDTTRVWRAEQDGYTVRVTWTLAPGQRFLSKQLTITGRAKDWRLGRVELLRTTLDQTLDEQLRTREGAFLRSGRDGLFVIAQNPFGQFARLDRRLSLGYQADLDWKPGYGPCATDRLCLGPYTLTGTTLPFTTHWDWPFVPADQPQPGARIDTAEVDALTACARAFLQWRPAKSIRTHIGWCENDYQIDVATPDGVDEYHRIIDQAAAAGVQYVLFTPGQSQLAPTKESRDAWGWENVLWLNLGQQLRRGDWDPEKDPVPASVQAMLDYAKAKGVKLMAYVYPSLPFLQQPAWTKWIKGTPGGYLGADTGQRSFQDWLVDKMVAFQQKTGIGGFCFDHWWIAYDDASSRYAQWYGCRRILEELRRRCPDTVIDGRQQYHWFGVWTWLAGSYPHPLCSDEQPQSFRAFPDLHWSRVSADRQRLASWHYRVDCFCPTELLPGYMTHQTNRLTPKGECLKTRFRPRDWDLLGWRYSVISAIGTAPVNHVLNMLPARDSDEYKLLGDADRAWLRGWLDWTDTHTELLRTMRPILGEPMVGRADGTAAIKDGHGFVFLFNPNYRPLTIDLPLDASLGLKGADELGLTQLYPESEAGKLLVAKAGDKLRLTLPGAEALVLEVGPLPAARPLLVGAAGRAALAGDRLTLTGVTGEPGTQRSLRVLLPPGAAPREATLNRVPTPLTAAGELTARFAGAACGRLQQLGVYDPAFKGGDWQATLRVPARVLAQLAARERACPVKYTDDDLLATWLGSHRLLLFVNIAAPEEKLDVTAQLDGQPLALQRAYSSVYPLGKQCFVGWYADVSKLTADAPHDLKLKLPELAAGRFQGVFLENVESEWTQELQP